MPGLTRHLLFAIKLYEKNGYEYITTKPHYYDDGEDAIYMVRSLVS